MSARSDVPAATARDGASSHEAAVVPVGALAATTRAAMLALMKAHYLGVSERGFSADLDEKDAAVLLWHQRRLVGFSTLARLDTVVDGRDVTAIFSGDTIVRPDAQGYSNLARAWSRHAFGLAAAIRLDEPERRVYWLLISAGYKTYRFLPLFFRRYLPAAGREPEPFDAAVATALAECRYGSRFDAAAGVVRLEHPTPLRAGVADVTAARLRDPHVSFFVASNPGHARGDELVCLALLAPDNVTVAGRRMLGLRTAGDGGHSAPALADERG